MRATAKLVNAINNGSIVAFVAVDPKASACSFAQCRQINPMGGLDSDFTLDPIALQLFASGIGWAQGAPSTIVGITVTLPGWVGAKDPSIRLDIQLNVVNAPDSAALTKMANAGYFA